MIHGINKHNFRFSHTVLNVLSVVVSLYCVSEMEYVSLQILVPDEVQP